MKMAIPICLGILLCGCAGKKTTREWIQQLQSKDASLRIEAIKALENNKSEAGEVVPHLMKILKDDNAFVRRDAAQALGKLASEAKPAVPSLVLLLKDKNNQVRRSAMQALRQIDPEAATKKDREMK